MGAKIRNKNRSRMSQEQIDKLLAKEESVKFNGDATVSIMEPVEEPIIEDIPVIPAPKKKTKPLLHNTNEYDSMKPEEHIRDFIAYIRSCLARYEYDQDHLTEMDDRLQDIMHFAEMAEDKKSREGYKLYKELAAARRERRACKCEIELLYPVYELFHGTKILDQMAMVQGNCKTVRNAIKSRVYTTRTDVLDQFCNDEKE